MRNTFLLTAIAAPLVLSSAAIAQTTAGGGVTQSTHDGSTAAGATMGTMHSQQHRKSGKMRRGQDRQEQPTTATGNSSSTYGSGTVYTDRNHATGGVTAGGTATGTGSQSSSTSIDAYGSTTKSGSDAEVYGDSTANSTQPTNPQR
jgi:hypothetical protein